jgi:putative membrane protein
LGREKAKNKEMVDTVKVFLLNQGFYNLFLALGTLYGLATGNASIVNFSLLCYIGAGAVLVISSPDKLKPACIQMIPALLGFFL